MTFEQLVEYINMDRWADPAFRSYDLMRGCGPVRAAKALRRIGYWQGSVALALGQLGADLASRGVKCENLRDTLCEWYVWQRLNDGEVRQWPMREKSVS